MRPIGVHGVLGFMRHSFTRLPFLGSMSESPRGRAAWGSHIRIVDLGEGYRNGGPEKDRADRQIGMDLCAEWGAREVAGFADALCLPPCQPGQIPVPQTDLATVFRSALLPIFATTLAKSLGIKSSYVIAGMRSPEATISC